VTAVAGEPLFRAVGDGAFTPAAHTAGPWDPGALHGGAAAALIVRALEQVEGPDGLAVTRLSFELLRPIPTAELRIATTVVRAGRRVQELKAELHAGDQLVCRAGALRISPVERDVAAQAADSAGDAGVRAIPGPDEAEPHSFVIAHDPRDTFARALEMRFLDKPFSLAPTRVWMRLREPLLAGEPATPLQRLAAVADFGNGVSAVLPFAGFLFINADLHVHLWREPRGEWIGLDSRTILAPGGGATATSVIHDLDGPLGQAFQSLVVARR
jgi:acyl-Coa thioesterase superfamily protein/acyl-CoA thioesterase superfamily protein